MDRKRAWNIIKLVLKLAVTGLTLWIVYNKVDLNALSRIWNNAIVWLFAPALLFFGLSQLISSFRLLNFFKNIKLPISVKHNIILYIQGMFYNIFLPGGIGGDGYKILTLRNQYNTASKQIFSAVFFDRLSGLWALGFLIVLLSLFVPLFNDYTLPIAGVFVAGSIIYYFIIHFFFRIHSARFFKTHFLALLVQSCQLVSVAFILSALGCHEFYLAYLTIFLLSSLSTLFPFSIGGLGAREIAIVWAASMLQLNKDLAVSVSLCFYFISAVLSLSGIFVVFYSRKATAHAATERS